VVVASGAGGDVVIATAICLRQEAGEIQVLLIRTSSGKRYTFPKGHVEPEELLAQTVGRELLEEAGYQGCVQKMPVAVSQSGTERQVYYLVRSAVPRGEPERGRKPRWIDYQRAQELLTQERAPSEGETLLQALRAALAAYRTQ
jgi:8-oxo-dGTP diphosphatase